MYTLYYSPGACSMAAHVALNECGQDYKLEKVDIHGGQGQSPEFKQLNPRGQVPVLVVDGEPIREGGAILTWLCDTHNCLLPKSGIERARALQWLMWGNSSLHPAYAKTFWLKRNDQGDSPLMDSTLQTIQSMWDEAETQLGKTKFLAGDEPTIGDVLLTVIANWNGYLLRPVTFGPNTQRVLKAISTRPAYQKAMQEEEIEYKAAA